MVKRIAITLGEPAGIGADIVAMLAQRPLGAEIVVVGNAELLSQRAYQLQLPLVLQHVDFTKPAQPHQLGRLNIVDVPLSVPATAGVLNPANAAYVLDTLRIATQLCQQQQCQAMVTAPVHKGVINQAGTDFTGHTEFLAALTNTEQVVMMLQAPGLKVALATTHIPLQQVAKSITKQSLQGSLRIIHRAMQQQFGILHPKILVAGLNPHAGEGGVLGTEEIETIVPVMESLSSSMHLMGPLPADTLFTPKYLEQADVVLAMYHDQGLPVLKYLGFGQAVNVTLGLPVVRTSVDHGTALDLAASGQVSDSSLVAAVEAAIDMLEETPSDT